MASKFLEDLKKAAETGEFNSEVAKKINEINKIADEKIKTMVKPDEKIEDSELAKSVEKNSQVIEVKDLTEEEMHLANTRYEEQMKNIKENDIVNKQLAVLIDIEDMIKLSINDMFSFVDELEDKFKTVKENPNYSEMWSKITDINNLYGLLKSK